MHLEPEMKQKRQIAAIAATQIKDALSLILGLVDLKSRIITAGQSSDYPFGRKAAGMLFVVKPAPTLCI
jgi:hypothetical protein